MSRKVTVPFWTSYSLLADDSSIGGRIRRLSILSNSQTELASVNFEIMPSDNLAVAGLTDLF
jgi:hypothetical protein